MSLQESERVEIEFQPLGLRVRLSTGQPFLEVIRQLDIDLTSSCDGRGSCGRCRVQILRGEVSAPTSAEKAVLSEEELANGYRLACQTQPMGDCALHLPPESLISTPRLQVEGFEVAGEVDPIVRSYDVEIPPPSIDDPRADTARVVISLEKQHGVQGLRWDLEALREIPLALREQGWGLQLGVRGGELVAAAPRSSELLGLAVDLGTTKIAGYLVNLRTGHTLASKGALNPQIAMGEDVIARMARAKESPVETERLQQLAVSALQQLAADLCEEAGFQSREIVEAVVAGNTAMHHLLLRLPVEQLALSPYVPVVQEALDLKAREIGLQFAPGAYLHLLPNVGGFVGGDHIAFLLATRFDRSEGVSLAVDVGTNTEVCLAVDGQLTSLSCASGPAFEGAHIRHGMRSGQGAIEHMSLDNGEVQYRTIGNSLPVGICGTGLLEAAAQLFLAGILDRKGRMGEHPRMRVRNGEQEFVIAEGNGASDTPAVAITQRDVQQLQLAKGAIRAGIRILLEASGRNEEEISRVVIAGGFGSYLDVASAIAIGMLPRLPLERYRQVGNASGAGAKLVLVSARERAEAERIARGVRYLEPARAPRFMQIFAQSMYFG